MEKDNKRKKTYEHHLETRLYRSCLDFTISNQSSRSTPRAQQYSPSYQAAARPVILRAWMSWHYVKWNRGELSLAGRGESELMDHVLRTFVAKSHLTTESEDDAKVRTTEGLASEDDDGWPWLG
jgi:hypothetical protein